jgi:hypothetical protein
MTFSRAWISVVVDFHTQEKIRPARPGSSASLLRVRHTSLHTMFTERCFMLPAVLLSAMPVVAKTTLSGALLSGMSSIARSLFGSVSDYWSASNELAIAEARINADLQISMRHIDAETLCHLQTLHAQVEHCRMHYEWHFKNLGNGHERMMHTAKLRHELVTALVVPGISTEDAQKLMNVLAILSAADQAERDLLMNVPQLRPRIGP